MLAMMRRVAEKGALREDKYFKVYKETKQQRKQKSANGTIKLKVGCFILKGNYLYLLANLII